MQKFRIIFIDDSGDPGLKATSSRFLVFAAVIFDAPKPVNDVESILYEFKKNHHLHQKYELKFNKLRKSLILESLKSVKHINFKVKAVYVDKRKPLPLQKHNLYSWGIGELLKMVGVDGALVRIDGKTNKKQTRMSKTYLRKELSKNNMHAKDIRFDDSASSLSIQLADLVVGSIRRYLDADKTDSDKYYKIIRKHIQQIKEL